MQLRFSCLKNQSRERKRAEKPCRSLMLAALTPILIDPGAL